MRGQDCMPVGMWRAVTITLYSRHWTLAICAVRLFGQLAQEPPGGALIGSTWSHGSETPYFGCECYKHLPWCQHPPPSCSPSDFLVREWERPWHLIVNPTPTWSCQDCNIVWKILLLGHITHNHFTIPWKCLVWCYHSLVAANCIDVIVAAAIEKSA